MELWIDNTKIEDPTEGDVTRGFNSITGTGSVSSGISIVQLFRNDGSYLLISGHPGDGWLMPSFEENGKEFVCFDDKHPLSQKETIAMFQSYLQGDDSWKLKFKWEAQEKVRFANTLRNVVGMLLAGGILAFFLRRC